MKVGKENVTRADDSLTECQTTMSDVETVTELENNKNIITDSRQHDVVSQVDKTVEITSSQAVKTSLQTESNIVPSKLTSNITEMDQPISSKPVSNSSQSGCSVSTQIGETLKLTSSQPVEVSQQSGGNVPFSMVATEVTENDKTLSKKTNSYKFAENTALTHVASRITEAVKIPSSPPFKTSKQTLSNTDLSKKAVKIVKTVKTVSSQPVSISLQSGTNSALSKEVCKIVKTVKTASSQPVSNYQQSGSNTALSKGASKIVETVKTGSSQPVSNCQQSGSNTALSKEANKILETVKTVSSSNSQESENYTALTKEACKIVETIKTVSSSNSQESGNNTALSKGANKIVETVKTASSQPVSNSEQSETNSALSKEAAKVGERDKTGSNKPIENSKQSDCNTVSSNRPNQIVETVKAASIANSQQSGSNAALSSEAFQIEESDETVSSQLASSSPQSDGNTDLSNEMSQADDSDSDIGVSNEASKMKIILNQPVIILTPCDLYSTFSNKTGQSVTPTQSSDNIKIVSKEVAEVSGEKVTTSQSNEASKVRETVKSVTSSPTGSNIIHSKDAINVGETVKSVSSQCDGTCSNEASKFDTTGKFFTSQLSGGNITLSKDASNIGKTVKSVTSQPYDNDNTASNDVSKVNEPPTASNVTLPKDANNVSAAIKTDENRLTGTTITKTKTETETTRKSESSNSSVKISTCIKKEVTITNIDQYSEVVESMNNVTTTNEPLDTASVSESSSPIKEYMYWKIGNWNLTNKYLPAKLKQIDTELKQENLDVVCLVTTDTTCKVKATDNYNWYCTSALAKKSIRFLVSKSCPYSVLGFQIFAENGVSCITLTNNEDDTMSVTCVGVCMPDLWNKTTSTQTISCLNRLMTKDDNIIIMGNFNAIFGTKSIVKTDEYFGPSLLATNSNQVGLVLENFVREHKLKVCSTFLLDDKIISNGDHIISTMLQQSSFTVDSCHFINSNVCQQQVLTASLVWTNQYTNNSTCDDGAFKMLLWNNKSTRTNTKQLQNMINSLELDLICCNVSDVDSYFKNTHYQICRSCSSSVCFFIKDTSSISVVRYKVLSEYVALVVLKSQTVEVTFNIVAVTIPNSKINVNQFVNNTCSAAIDNVVSIILCQIDPSVAHGKTVLSYLNNLRYYEVDGEVKKILAHTKSGKIDVSLNEEKNCTKFYVSKYRELPRDASLLNETENEDCWTVTTVNTHDLDKDTVDKMLIKYKVDVACVQSNQVLTGNSQHYKWYTTNMADTDIAIVINNDCMIEVAEQLHCTQYVNCLVLKFKNIKMKIIGVSIPNGTNPLIALNEIESLLCDDVKPRILLGDFNMNIEYDPSTLVAVGNTPSRSLLNLVKWNELQVWTTMFNINNTTSYMCSNESFHVYSCYTLQHSVKSCNVVLQVGVVSCELVNVPADAAYAEDDDDIEIVAEIFVPVKAPVVSYDRVQIAEQLRNNTRNVTAVFNCRIGYLNLKKLDISQVSCEVDNVAYSSSIDVLCIHITRHSDMYTCKKTSRYNWYCDPIDDIVFLVQRKSSLLVQNYASVSRQVGVLDVYSNNKLLTLISAFIPQNSSTSSVLYETLQKIVDYNNVNNIILLGDFGAKIGNDVTSQLVGQVTLQGPSNNNGQKLVNFCCENGLKVHTTHVDCCQNSTKLPYVPYQFLSLNSGWLDRVKVSDKKTSVSTDGMIIANFKVTDCEAMPRPGGEKTDYKWTFITWNMTDVNICQSVNIIDRTLNTYDVQIACLQTKNKIPNNTLLTSSNYKWFHSEHTSILFLINKNFTCGTLTFRPISANVSLLTINSDDINIGYTFIGLNCFTGNDISEPLCDILKILNESIHPGPVIILGETKGVIGKLYMNKMITKFIGNKLVHSATNENGFNLIQFCNKYEFSLQTTLFRNLQVSDICHRCSKTNHILHTNHVLTGKMGNCFVQYMRGISSPVDLPTDCKMIEVTIGAWKVNVVKIVDTIKSNVEPGDVKQTSSKIKTENVKCGSNVDHHDDVEIIPVPPKSEVNIDVITIVDEDVEHVASSSQEFVVKDFVTLEMYNKSKPEFSFRSLYNDYCNNFNSKYQFFKVVVWDITNLKVRLSVIDAEDILLQSGIVFGFIISKPNLIFKSDSANTKYKWTELKTTLHFVLLNNSHFVVTKYVSPMSGINMVIIESDHTKRWHTFVFVNNSQQKLAGYVKLLLQEYDKLSPTLWVIGWYDYVRTAPKSGTLCLLGDIKMVDYKTCNDYNLLYHRSGPNLVKNVNYVTKNSHYKLSVIEMADTPTKQVKNRVKFKINKSSHYFFADGQRQKNDEGDWILSFCNVSHELTNTNHNFMDDRLNTHNITISCLQTDDKYITNERNFETNNYKWYTLPHNPLLFLINKSSKFQFIDYQHITNKISLFIVSHQHVIKEKRYIIGLDFKIGENLSRTISTLELLIKSLYDYYPIMLVGNFNIVFEPSCQTTLYHVYNINVGKWLQLIFEQSLDVCDKKRTFVLHKNCSNKSYFCFVSSIQANRMTTIENLFTFNISEKPSTPLPSRTRSKSLATWILPKLKANLDLLDTELHKNKISIMNITFTEASRESIRAKSTTNHYECYMNESMLIMIDRSLKVIKCNLTRNIITMIYRHFNLLHGLVLVNMETVDVQELQAAVSDVKNVVSLHILGNMNVEIDRHYCNYSNAVHVGGKLYDDTTNDNGKSLITFAIEHDFTILNTTLEKRCKNWKLNFKSKFGHVLSRNADLQNYDVVDLIYIDEISNGNQLLKIDFYK